MMATQTCVIDYRVSKVDFPKAVELYTALSGKAKPDYDNGVRALIKVFEIKAEGADRKYSVEVRVTTVPDKTGGSRKFNPVIYYGTDDVQGDYDRLLKKPVKDADDEDLHQDPIPNPSTPMNQTAMISAVDHFANRSGTTINPPFPFAPPRGDGKSRLVRYGTVALALTLGATLLRNLGARARR